MFTRRKATTAGWGLVVFEFGDVPENGVVPIVSACGPVDVESKSSMFLGAERWTNNTAELSAAAEFLLWLIAQAENPELGIKDDSTVVLHSDSRYVIGLVTGRFHPRENIILTKLVRHLWKTAVARFDLHVAWVKGHANVHGNELADKAANDGGDTIKKANWWSRPYSLRDWVKIIF